MMYKPNSTWTWFFMAVATLQAIIGVALEGYVFGKFESEILSNGARASSKSRSVPTYLSVFMFGYLYELVLVYDALRLKNTIQVIGICLYNIGILIYAAIQIDQIHDAVNDLKGGIRSNFWNEVQPFLIALPCLMAVGTVLLSIVAWKLYDEFAWTIYKHISADLRLKRRYLTYQIYIALLKFDFFFFLGFTVQFLVIVTNTQDVEFYLTIAAVPITVALLILAAFWTRRESVIGMVFTIFIYFCALAYFLFKLVRMYGSDANRVRDYLPARRMLTTFAVITILLLVTTIVIACMCTRNFGKGLKPHVTKRKVVSEGDNGKSSFGGYSTEMPDYRFNGGGGQAGSRMTID